MKRRSIVALCLVARRRCRGRGRDARARPRRRPQAASPSGCRSTRSPAGRTSSRPRTSSSSRPSRRDGRTSSTRSGTRTCRSSTRRSPAAAARRDRDGQHRDDEVHGGRRVRRLLDKSSFDNSSTWLKGLAASARTTARSTASRTTPARASSPTAPTCSRRPASRSCRRRPRSTSPTRKKLLAKNKAEGLLAGLHRRHRLVRRDGLRLRLRRQHRDADQRQVEGPARLAASRSPA